MNPITTVLFDVGTVLVELDFSHLLDRFDFDLAAFQQWPPYDAYERGQIDEAEFLRLTNEHLNLELSVPEYHAWWNSILAGPVAGVPELLQELHGKTTLFALTNTSPTHYRYLIKHYEWLSPFRRIYSSFELHSRKPELEIYERFCQSEKLSPGEVLFIDDKLENVLAARTVGMAAELSEGPLRQTRAILNKYGVL